MAQRQLHLGAFMRPTSLHPGAWRYPGAWPDANFNFPRMKTLIRKLEAAKFDASWHIARRFASLDHISGGRAGWNIVTTSNPDAALNFGLEEHMEHGDRYVRAREFYDVVTGLWDSFADDAFIRDAEHGIYSDPQKLHVLEHKGK